MASTRWHQYFNQIANSTMATTGMYLAILNNKTLFTRGQWVRLCWPWVGRDVGTGVEVRVEAEAEWVVVGSGTEAEWMLTGVRVGSE